MVFAVNGCHRFYIFYDGLVSAACDNPVLFKNLQQCIIRSELVERLWLAYFFFLRDHLIFDVSDSSQPRLPRGDGRTDERTNYFSSKH